MNEMFSLGPYNINIIHDDHSNSKDTVQNKELGNLGKLPQLPEKDDCEDPLVNNLLSKKVNAIDQETVQDSGNLDALFLHTPSYPHQIQKLTALESEFSQLINPHKEKHTGLTSKKSKSTDEIIRLGGERFIQSFSPLINDFSTLSHPYGSSFSGVDDMEITKDIELIQNLLLSAEKVGQQQFDRSTKLLDWCDELSSYLGNPIQRLVHYFSKALRAKIATETGRIAGHGMEKNHISDLEDHMVNLNLTSISIYQKLPFFQVGKFAGVQALVDAVNDAKKVHIIDLAIRNGLQCTILMQALASRAICPIDHIKITAIGTKMKENIEETGQRLTNFAHSINLSFSFKIAMVGDILDLKDDLFELDQEEAIAVFSSYSLWPMLSQPDRLESLMKVIKNTNPRVMVVTEIEANLNSPVFVNRFIETLFFYGSFFDSVEDCMDREDRNRIVVESMLFGESIRNIVGFEGDKRTIRQVKIEVWRKFFERFGMREIELSMSSLYQANLLVEKFSCGSSCSFEMDGKCLIIGWKGTPIQSLSAWTFS